MALNCFDNVPHEALDFCPNEEIAAGISTRLFYVPTAFLDKCILPKSVGGYEDRVSINADDLTLIAGKGWKGIDVLIDEGELKTSLVGNTGNKKARTELEVYIPSFRAKALGFIDTYKNVPMSFAVIDATGVAWIVGTKINPAYVESAEGATGKKTEDNSGITLKITANSKLYKYKGVITEEPTAVVTG